MRDRFWPLYVLVLGTCLLLIVDQFYFTRTERTTFVDASVSKEFIPEVGRSRWSRREHPDAPKRSRRTHNYFYFASLSNGRVFQLEDGSNGTLQHQDSVRIRVSSILGRVLSFSDMEQQGNHQRTTVDAFEELVPFPIVIAMIPVWLLVGKPGSGTRYYLRMLMIVVILVFVVAIFGECWRRFAWLMEN